MTSLGRRDSDSDDVMVVARWRDEGRRRWTPRLRFVVRSSKNVLLASVFVAVLLNQLLSTTVGKRLDFLIITQY